jgi:TM2 domain
MNPASHFCIACGAASGGTAAPPTYPAQPAYSPQAAYPAPAPQQFVMVSDSMDGMLYMQGMTPNQQLYFHAEMEKVRKNPSSAFWLLLFLGGVGAHHFYLGNTGRAVAYLLFFWTSIPLWISLFEIFTIKAKVRQMNSSNAAQIAMRVKMLVTA